MPSLNSNTTNELITCLVKIDSTKPCTKDFVIQQYNNLVNWIKYEDPSLNSNLSTSNEVINTQIEDLNFLILPISIQEMLVEFEKMDNLLYIIFQNNQTYKFSTNINANKNFTLQKFITRLNLYIDAVKSLY